MSRTIQTYLLAGDQLLDFLENRSNRPDVAHQHRATWRVMMDGSSELEGEEERIRAVENAYDRAWSGGDLDSLMQCLSADAVLVNPRGEVAVGEQAIRSVLGTFLSGEATGSQHRSIVNRIAFVRPDVAVVDGTATVSFRSSDSVLQHPFTDVLVNGESGWVIAHVRAYFFDKHT